MTVSPPVACASIMTLSNLYALYEKLVCMYVCMIILMNLLIPFPFGWLLNKKAARVEVNMLLALLYCVGIALHP